jgi:hypothetical protein
MFRYFDIFFAILPSYDFAIFFAISLFRHFALFFKDPELAEKFLSDNP